MLRVYQTAAQHVTCRPVHPAHLSLACRRAGCRHDSTVSETDHRLLVLRPTYPVSTKVDACAQVAVLVLSLQLRSALQGNSAIDLARAAASADSGGPQHAAARLAAAVQQQPPAAALLPGYQERRLPAAAPSDYMLKVRQQQCHCCSALCQQQAEAAGSRHAMTSSSS